MKEKKEEQTMKELRGDDKIMSPCRQKESMTIGDDDVLLEV